MRLREKVTPHWGENFTAKLAESRGGNDVIVDRIINDLGLSMAFKDVASPPTESLRGLCALRSELIRSFCNFFSRPTN